MQWKKMCNGIDFISIACIDLQLIMHLFMLLFHLLSIRRSGIPIILLQHATHSLIFLTRNLQVDKIQKCQQEQWMQSKKRNLCTGYTSFLFNSLCLATTASFTDFMWASRILVSRKIRLCKVHIYGDFLTSKRASA